MKCKDIKKLFNEIILKSPPNIRKFVDIHRQEQFSTTNRHDRRKTFPQHIIIKMPKLQNCNNKRHTKNGRKSGAMAQNNTILLENSCLISGSHDCSQPSSTLVSWDPVPFSGLLRQCMHGVHWHKRGKIVIYIKIFI